MIFRIKSGFTLLEMMIALTAGAGILLIAVAGFRASSQVVRAAQKISSENISFNAGILAAFDEADAWGSCSTKRFLTQSVSMGTVDPNANQPSNELLSEPLTPFSTSWPVSMIGRGWQEDERMWFQSADNPLTWWTGVSVQEQNIPSFTDNNFADVGVNHVGYFSIFGASRLPSSSAPPASGALTAPVSQIEVRACQGASAYGLNYGFFPQWETQLPSGSMRGGAVNDPSLTVYKRCNSGWMYNQIRGLLNAMGPYGALDYLPQNAIIAYVAPAVKDSTNATGTDRVGRPRYLTASSRTGGSGVPYGFVHDFFSYNGIPYYRMGWTVSTIPDFGRRGGFLGAAVDRSLFGYFSLFYFIPNNPLNSVSNVVDYSHNACGLGATWRPGTARAGIQEDFLDPIVGVGSGVNYTIRGMLFDNKVSEIRSLLSVYPRSWTGVDVMSSRYLYRSRYAIQLRVRGAGIDSGEFRFTCMGSTLRGFRRQAGLEY